MDKPTRIPSPPHVVFREIRVAVLPFVAFAVVLGLTILTWRSYVGPGMMVGEVEPVRGFINAPQSGKITVLNVGLLDRVSAGQTIGQLLPADPRVLSSQLALGRARISYLRDALDARLRQQNNEIAYLQLRLDWLSQRAELATLKAQLSYYKAELDRQDRMALATNRITSQAEHEVAKRDHESLAAQIEERGRLVEEMGQAISRLTPEEAKLNEEAPAALRTALEIEERELGVLEAQLGPTALVAPFDGVVSGILHRSGEQVKEGDTILTLSGDKPERVIAYVRQPIHIDIKTNMMVEIRSRGGKRETGLGRVLSVGTQLEPILPELLPRGTGSTVAEYGLPFLVSLPQGVSVRGGETVDLVIPEPE